MEHIADQLRRLAKDGLSTLFDEAANSEEVDYFDLKLVKLHWDDLEKRSQALVRRSVSTAYYAVFHALIEASVERVAGEADRAVRAAYARAYDHGAITHLARSVTGGKPKEVLRHVFPDTSPELRELANSFAALQQERHAADYDLSVPFDLFRAQRALELMEDAFRVLAEHEQRGIAAVGNFLTLLPVAKQLLGR